MTLSPRQQQALQDLSPPGVLGLRPGDNVASEVEYVYQDGTRASWDLSDLMALHRLGLARADPADKPWPVQGGSHPELGEMMAEWRWTWTEAGAAAVAGFARA
jgi:hypothetical protein